MSNRIGGDFNQEAIEAFRAAYAQQLNTPDSEEVANNSGLPTDTIPNTSPWFNHVGLWTANDGRSIDYKNKTPFNPDSYYSNEIVDGDEDEDDNDSEFDEIIDEIANQAEE